MSKIQGLLKASPAVFKGLKLMKNTDLSDKLYFRNAYADISTRKLV